MGRFDLELGGFLISIHADETLFCPNGLDRGTRYMIETASFHNVKTFLDLGCGSGIVGIYAAKILCAQDVWMCDIDARAVANAKRNAEINGVAQLNCVQSDGMDALPAEVHFDRILANPPYHADFSVPKKWIKQSFYRLNPGGRLYMVTKRRDWYEKRIAAVFGGVRVYEKEDYFVFEAEKRTSHPPQKKKAPARLSKKLQKKYALKEKRKR